MKTTLGLLLIALVSGCGDSTGTPPQDLAVARDLSTGGGNDLATAADMATAAGDMAAGGDMAGGGMVTLKLEDYLSWCSVAVNNGAAGTTALQTLQFPAGTVVNLGGDKASA